tara:strand:- start:1052 stop:1300 length:249 start_codon:yes stop_codon:yes gene_type:complete
MILYVFKMNPEAKQLYDSITEKKELMWSYSRQITILTEDIRKMRKMLYKTCEHEWVRDWEDRDERSSWICKHCKLSRNPYHN